MELLTQSRMLGECTNHETVLAHRPREWCAHHTLAGALWYWSELCFASKGPGKNHKIFTVAKAFTNGLLPVLAGLLEKWILKQHEPTTTVLVALQPAGKRVGPGLMQRLLRKVCKRAATRGWCEDGMAVTPNVDHAVEKHSSRYLHETHQAMRRQVIIELLMDSTVFATQDVQVTITFA